jgi:hypothetical protein
MTAALATEAQSVRAKKPTNAKLVFISLNLLGLVTLNPETFF